MLSSATTRAVLEVTTAQWTAQLEDTMLAEVLPEAACAAAAATATAVRGEGDLTYGELTVDSLRELLHHHLPAVQNGARRTHGGGGGGHPGRRKFVDLGSGSGRVVLAAALLGDFDEVLGVEIDPLRDACAQRALEAFDAHPHRGLSPATAVRFERGDATDPDTVARWCDADVVFVCCTCFTDGLLRRLAAAATHLRAGALVVTTTKALPAPPEVLLPLGQFSSRCTWGHAELLVFVREAAPPHGAAPE